MNKRNLDVFQSQSSLIVMLAVISCNNVQHVTTTTLKSTTAKNYFANFCFEIAVGYYDVVRQFACDVIPSLLEDYYLLINEIK